MGFAKRTRGNNLLEVTDNFTDEIQSFKTRIKYPFMEKLFSELNNAMMINDNELLAFDVFNPKCDSDGVKMEKIKNLMEFYGTEKSSTFEVVTKTALSLFNASDHND